jgi:hypothetical protein
MDDKILFVQFLHPGGEHGPDDDGVHKEWNTKNHRHKRKFLKQAGKYIIDAKVEKGEMCFWGEWEPESIVHKIGDPIHRGPRFIHKPYYFVPKSYYRLQNTDPFVFGEQFHYTWCQQRTKKGATQLRHLSEGSVILFGSCETNAFVLDTVFVVRHWKDHTRTTHPKDLAGAISQQYKEVSILPGYAGSRVEGTSCTPAGREKEWRLHSGASYDNPVQGMYSFFPCRPYEVTPKGFARPRIHLPGKIRGNLYQSKKYSEPLSPENMKLDWEEVVRQVKAEGLGLGVYAEMPKRREQSTTE